MALITTHLDGFVYNKINIAIDRFVPKYLERCEKVGRKPFRKTAQEWMDWWIYELDTIDYTDSFLDI